MGRAKHLSLCYLSGGLNLARSGAPYIIGSAASLGKRVRIKFWPEHGHSLPNCTILRGLYIPCDLLEHELSLGYLGWWSELCEKGDSVHYSFCCQQIQTKPYIVRSFHIALQRASPGHRQTIAAASSGRLVSPCEKYIV